MASVAVYSDRGTQRPVNQDACCLQVADTPFGEVVMAVVCDGVGGLALGELASATVVQAFAAWFRDELPTVLSAAWEGLDVARTLGVWEHVLEQTNSRLVSYGLHHGVRLGTTFTGVLACNGRYVVGQVGDSRLYVLDADGCRQVTQDQSLVADLVAHGELSAEDASHHPLKNVISQAVGAARELCPVFSQGAYGTDDVFVLCSDGMYRTGGPEKLRLSLPSLVPRTSASLQTACKQAASHVLRKGERDNLTMVCFSLGLDDAPSPDVVGR